MENINEENMELPEIVPVENETNTPNISDIEGALDILDKEERGERIEEDGKRSTIH